MSPAKKKPAEFTVTVGGERLTVVEVNARPPYWVHRRPSGQLVMHPGKLLVKGQPLARWLDKPKPCTKCKQPTQAATPLGRAIHDTCEGWTNVLPDELAAQVIFGVAADLGAHILYTTEAR